MGWPTMTTTLTTTLRGFYVKNPLTVIGGIITLIGLLLVAVWVFASTGGLTQDQRNYAFITIVGLVVNAIPSLLSLLKSEATQHDIRNGVVKAKVKDAVQELAEEADSPVTLTVAPDHETQEGKAENG